MISSYSTPSIPPSEVAFDSGSYGLRREQTYMRRCFMEGGWPSYLVGALRSILSEEAAQSMPAVDTSHNVLRDTVSRLATRYEYAPSVREGELGDLLPTDLWSGHVDAEKGALAYGVSVVSVRMRDDELVTDVLPPDHADVEWDDDGRVSRVRLARPVNVASLGQGRYKLEEWDLVNRTYSVFTGSGWVKRDGYPWVYADGRPFAPVVFYRASRVPDWWDSGRWSELVEATLEEGIAWTIHRYGRLNSSTGVPWVMDADPVGQTSDGSDEGRRRVTVGSNVVLQLNSRPNKAGGVGVMQATFDPEKDVEAISAAYNSRMSSLGIGEDALQRKGAESGYAIVVRREGLLRLRRSTEPLFRSADQEYARVCAALSRLFGRGPKESDRYRVEYADVTGGTAENGERRDQEKHDVDVGVATPASILSEREGIPLEEAEAKLARLGLPSRPQPVAQPVARVTPDPGAVPVLPVAPAVQPARVDREEYPFVGFVDFQGLKIDLENRKGDVRSGLNTDGSPWSVVMNYDYGEIRGTKGTDGDKLDVYVGPLHDSPLVVAVNQHDPVTGAFDEQKVMLGFATVEDAVAAYRSQYDSPGFYVEGDYEVMTFGAFWRAVKDRKFHGKRLDGTDLQGQPAQPISQPA